MARTCGIRIGPRRFEIVVLDGGAKKHRIVAFKSGEFPQGGADPMADAVAALKAAIEELKVPLEATSIAIDTGLAAFRTLKLPALDEAKIEEILKFEVENQLPQWNIDDVVIDFMVLDKTADETQLLVSAVPKAALKRELDVCSKAGVEPLEAELEATAMINAALASDICHVDDAQIIVHIGEASTAVVVVDGGKVRSMRAIHIGALTHDAAVAAEPAEGADTEAAAEAAKRNPPSPSQEDAQRRMDQVVSRIRRELGRTLSGARTAHPIQAIYVCGWELPNLIGTQVLDIPVYELDVFEADGGQPAEGAAPLVVAYGVALRMLGGATLKPALRREELRFAGTFERLELPLAVAVLMLVTWLAVFNIFEGRRVRHADDNLALWMESNKNFLINDPKQGKRGNLEKPWPDINKRVEESMNKVNDTAWTRLELIQQIEGELKRKIADLNKSLGNTGEVTQPQSALEALTLVTVTIDEMKDQIGRVAIRKVVADYQPTIAKDGEYVDVTLDLSFYSEDGSVSASRAYETLSNGLRTKPWVREVLGKTTKEFPNGGGISTDAFVVRCDLSKIERAKEVAQ